MTKKKRTPKRWEEIVQRISREGTLVEVGTWKGDTAFKVLSERPDVHVIMVDPWVSGLVDAGLIDASWLESGSKMATRAQSEVEAIYRSVFEKAEKFGSRARILRMESFDAAQQFEDGSLDMVFIDANHSYESVQADVAVWTLKVKPGGIIGGHDYNHPRFPGVRQAVVEAFGEKAIETAVDRTWWCQR